jgi:hypothetical protein
MDSRVSRSRETVNWYWIVDEIEAGEDSRTGQRAVGQTDDGHGEQERQAGCQRDEPAAKNGTCRQFDPSVFGSRRRELPRTRMVLSRQRTH